MPSLVQTPPLFAQPAAVSSAAAWVRLWAGRLPATELPVQGVGGVSPRLVGGAPVPPVATDPICCRFSTESSARRTASSAVAWPAPSLNRN